ncbi:MAG TPA: DUF3450 family protein [Planctomycetota bacterium]|nr:DUF3450 family protein [Planctomycetota bacterium]
MSAAFVLAGSATLGDPNPGDGTLQSAPPSLGETRLKMEKWIETQQIISKERNDWNQGKEILLGRLELVQKEVATLEEAIARDQASVAEANAKKAELLAENAQLESAGAQLTAAVAGMEGEVRELYRRLPEPLQTTLQPLFQRMPTESTTTTVAVAERFQNVLGILDAVNKANNEISVSYEVRTLADGAPSEVKVIYIGLAQAYYVSARGEAGTGRPGTEGWTWEPSPAIAKDVAVALEILEGKHTPAFVPLPVTLQ